MSEDNEPAYGPIEPNPAYSEFMNFQLRQIIDRKAIYEQRLVVFTMTGNENEADDARKNLRELGRLSAELRAYLIGQGHSL